MPSSEKIFQCLSPKGIKLVTRLRLSLIHLREHKFKHSFQDTLNSLCSRGLDRETTLFSTLSLVSCWMIYFLNNINEIYSTKFNKSDSVVTCILLYGNESFKDQVNFSNLECSYWFCFVYKLIWWTTSSSLNSRVFFFLFIIIWLQLYNF